MSKIESANWQIIAPDVNCQSLPSENEKGTKWKTGILRFQNVLNKRVLSKDRPKTTLATSMHVRGADDVPSKSISKTMISAKTQPIFINTNQEANPNRLTSYQDSFRVTCRSFDAHFQKHTEAVHSYEEKSWEISQRIYKRRLEQTKVKHKELNPVPSLIDSYAIETIQENRNKERRLSNMPLDHPIKRHQLPPEKNLTPTEQHRVFFWG